MKNILLVDDSIEFQEMISELFFAHTQYKVYTAEDGEIALDQVKNNPPDIIILDIIIPRINGLALLRALRNIEMAKNIPVILISGTMMDDETKKEGFALGAVDFFEKPVNMQHLIEKVEEILSQ